MIHKNNKGRYTIVNPSITKGGYLTYTLSKPARNYNKRKVRDENGNPKQLRVCKPAHVLVARLYVKSNYPETEYTISELEVHHKDGNRINNYYKNLIYLNSKDHGFIHTIKKIALYKQSSGQFRTYKDIEVLAQKLNIDVLQLLENLKFSDRLFRHEGWDIYKINDNFIGVKFRKEKAD